MANATDIDINDLTANEATAAPTADACDTGTAAVTLDTAAAVDAADRCILRVENTAAANLTVTVKAGDNVRPAWRKSLGDYTSGNIAQNATVYVGPFEAARFIQADGKLQFTFTPASGTIGCNFDLFRLPTV